MADVLVLGGYGQYGARISSTLAAEGLHVIVGGRSAEKAQALCDFITNISPSAVVEPRALDATKGFADLLADTRPMVVVDTCGPFQKADYRIAEACINAGVHYVDLADARGFVTKFGTLDGVARTNNVLAVTGASSLPALSAAVIDRFADSFSKIRILDIGISAAQRTPRGLATTQSILTYLGRKFTHASDNLERYGWQNLHRRKYPLVGSRWLSNIDVPDIDLLAERYGAEDVKCYAGLEVPVLHIGMWLMSWAVRAAPRINPVQFARVFVGISNLFDMLGSGTSAMHVVVTGENHNGQTCDRSWFIVARDGDGPNIPCVPAIVLVRKLVSGRIEARGAVPCLGLVTLDEYLAELTSFKISTMSLPVDGELS